MDETQTRDLIQGHARAIERGDTASVTADFAEALRPQAPQIVESLPQPVTSAQVLSVDVGDSESVALIRYSGESGEVTIRSFWQDEGGRPVIVRAEPAT